MATSSFRLKKRVKQLFGAKQKQRSSRKLRTRLQLKKQTRADLSLPGKASRDFCLRPSSTRSTTRACRKVIKKRSWENSCDLWAKPSQCISSPLTQKKESS